MLNLGEEVQAFLLDLDETDERLQKLSERKLRGLVGSSKDEQRLTIEKMIN